MTPDDKAEEFAEIAEEHGWDVTVDHRDDGDSAVTAEKGSLRLFIWWNERGLHENPQLTNGDSNTILLHNAEAARRILRNGLESSSPTTGKPREKRAPIRHPLPFTLEDSDKTILRALRGREVRWINALTGNEERSTVARVARRRGELVKMNTDLDNVFFLAENEQGRVWVSFMDPGGTFRAVYLDALLSVK